jgi:hypothetical protein
MGARTDLWEPGGRNPPGPPGEFLQPTRRRIDPLTKVMENTERYRYRDDVAELPAENGRGSLTIQWIVHAASSMSAHG